MTDFEKVIDFRNMYRAYRKSKSGKGFKKSSARFNIMALDGINALIEQLKDKPLGETLLIPNSMLRQGEQVFLDDVTVEELEEKLNVKVKSISNDGYELIDAICGKDN